MSFPSTHWSQIVASDDPLRKGEAIRCLARDYWGPIHRYIQRKWGKSVEDADDLTQEFFRWILESDFLGRADPTRGRLRAFVRVALEHFVGQERRKSRRVKRGGGAALISLSPDDAVSRAIVDRDARPPEQLLDEEWRARLLERATVRLRERCESEGRPEVFAIFAARLLGDGDDPPAYEELAAQLGLSRAAVSNHLQKAKKQFRELLREMVAETVTDPRELTDEYLDLFGGAGE